MDLRWENIDFSRKTAVFYDTKNGDDRTAPLSSAAVAVLHSLPRDLAGRVFPISEPAVEQGWRRARKHAVIEDLHFHDLRHEATSRLFEKGLNPMQVAAITGHKTLQMLKRYTHLRAEDLAKLLG
nr:MULTISPECIES: site-specific integrase [Acidithiobacillus]